MAPITGQSKPWTDQGIHQSGPSRILFIARLVASTQSLPVYYSSAGCADYTEDGIPDMALTGVTFSGSSINLLRTQVGCYLKIWSKIYRLFLVDTFLGLSTNDGRLDLTMTGFQLAIFLEGLKLVFINGKWTLCC